MSKLLCATALLAFGLPVHAGALMGGAPIKATAPKASASAAKATPKAIPKKDEGQKDAPRK